MHPTDMGLDQGVERRAVQPVPRDGIGQGLEHRMALARRARKDAVHLLAPPDVAHLGQQRLGHPRGDRHQFRLEGIERDQVRAQPLVGHEPAGQPPVSIGGADLGVEGVGQIS